MSDYDFILCDRNASDDGGFGGGGGGGSVFYLKIPKSENRPLLEHKEDKVQDWLDLIVRQAKAGDDDGYLDIVFFVHGYNTDPEEALKRQRLVEKELRARKFPCIVVGFDWPTGGSAVLYEYDRFQAQLSAHNLIIGGIVPFAMYNRADCPINIHVMAHSMGGFVVREAFRSVDKARRTNIPNDWRVGQLVLFAADLSSDSFAVDNTDMLPVFDHCGRLTNYFSTYDKALGVSSVKNLDIESRVGRVGMPPDTPGHTKALDVDCGPRYNAIPEETRKNFKVIDGMVSHSWYLEDDVWYDDLAHTLRGQIDRNQIPSRSKVGENDFILNAV